MWQAVLVATAGAFTFTAAPGSPYGFPGSAESAALGDFTGDGLPDFAVGVNTHSPANPGGTASVSMMLADGAGGFGYASGNAHTVSSVELGEGGISVATADFNSDGHLDLAATDYSDVSILLGNGDGTFGSNVSQIPDDRHGVQVVVADFNSDHKPDLAVLNDDDTVSVFLGNGDGTFVEAPGVPITLGSEFARTIAVGDFNGDGKPDLVVQSTASDSSSSISVLLGSGDGTFTLAPGSPIILPRGFASIAVADFNRDGEPDLGVVAGAPVGDTDTYSDTVSVLLGKGDGSFTPAPALPLRFSGPLVLSVVPGDFNSDGAPDLAFVGVMQLSASVYLLLGDGNGHFRLASGSPSPLGQPGSVFRAFMLAPGTLDGRQALLVSYGNPDGLLAVLLAPPPSEPPAAAINARPASALTGAPVLLDASASSDPLDRQLVDYRWDLGTGRFDHQTGTRPTISWSFMKPGTTQVRVQVTNTAGQTATASLRLVVRNPPVVRAPPRNAVIAGYVQVCGGPAPGRCRVEKIGLCTQPRGCVTSDRVAAIDSRGRRVAVGKLKRGRFRLLLTPGHYTIELLGDGRHVHGRVIQRRRATARAHRTATIRFAFDVP